MRDRLLAGPLQASIVRGAHVLGERTDYSLKRSASRLDRQTKRIIDAIAKRLGVTEKNCYINLHRTGNTSAATIPVAVDEIVQKGGLESGDYLLMVAS